MRFASPDRVHLHGALGEAVDANVRGRLRGFVQDEGSPAIALFDPERCAVNTAGDWYGEHAGKWLWAASRAAARTGDAQLRESVLRVTAYLAQRQDADGYLGNYAASHRFTVRQPPPPPSWDGAPSRRTWDIWTHSTLMLGLIETHRQLGAGQALDTACRIGDLCWNTLVRGDIDLVELGNHHGLSATVLLDPVMELYFATGTARYLELAQHIHARAERHPPLGLVRRALEGADVSEISTGKAYQLLWNMVGLAKLFRATGEANLLAALRALWSNVREHHLTLGGGPHGGVGHRSREVFNPRGIFSPHAYVETCSIMAWVQLNRELLALTGDGCFAQEIERSAYNDLLGAQADNGEDWCYYSFANGQRVHTTYWRCCKSSGAMALEALPELAYGTVGDDGIAVNLLGPSAATLSLAAAGEVELTQHTEYPFGSDLRIGVRPQAPAPFEIRIRRPDWVSAAALHLNGEALEPSATAPGYWSIRRRWRAGDELVIDLPMPVQTHRRSQRSVQESFAPDGAAVSQEVQRLDYLALTRGPLVYATGPIDGWKIADTFRMPEHAQADSQDAFDASQAATGGAVHWRAAGRSSVPFLPYYQVGERRDGAWRLTWLALAPH